MRSNTISFDETDRLFYKNNTRSVLVPSAVRFPILQHLHSLGHHGSRALCSLVTRYNFFIPNLPELAAQIISNCDACSRGKSCHGGPPREKLPKPSVPFTVIALDYLTINDTLKLLVMVDLTSGFTDTIPVSEATGYSTLSAIQTLFFRWGFPSAILTDNGKSFIFDPLQSWLKSVGVTSLLTPLYSPQSNGKCEQAVRSVMDSIRITFFAKRLSSIPIVEILPEILFGLNSIPKSGDQLAPRDYIFYYRERCPYISNPVNSSRKFKGNFKVGDKVFLKSATPFPSKLDPRFDEGGVITEHVANYTYLIQKADKRFVKYREDKIRHKSSAPTDGALD